MTVETLAGFYLYYIDIQYVFYKYKSRRDLHIHS